MSEKITKNYIYNLIYQVLLVISPVITIPFLSRTLGANGIGEYSYAYAITSFFVLFASLGCDIYGRREISYLKNDIKKRSYKFFSIEAIKIIFTILVLFFYIIFSLKSQNKTLLLILAFHIINVPLNISWFYQGIEEFKRITIRGIILKIIELIFIIFFVKKPSDLELYVFGTSFINFIAFFLLWININKYVTRINVRKLKLIEDFKNCMVFFIPTIASTLYTLIDKTMIGKITEGYNQNGYYEQTLKINVILLRIVLALGVVLMPKIALAYKKKEKEKINYYINLSARYVYFISYPIAFGFLACSNIFVPWFFGNDFLPVINLLKISGFILIFQGLNDVIGMQYMVSVGKQKKYIKSLLIGNLINITLNFYFIFKYNAVGAIFASLIGEGIIVFIQLFYVRKSLNVKQIFKIGNKYLFASIIMCLILLIISSNMTSSVLNTVILVFIGAGSYSLILMLLKDNLINYILKYLYKKLNRR